jgi:hypothetical protein
MATERFKDCSFATVRQAVDLATEGITSQLRETVEMSADDAYRYAHSLIGRAPVLLSVASPWLHVGPA